MDIELAYDAVRKGERTRILFEILLSELGLEDTANRKDIWDELKQVQEDYEQAIVLLSTVIKETHNSKLNEIKQTQIKDYDFPKDENYVANILKKEMGKYEVSVIDNGVEITQNGLEKETGVS